MKYSFHPDAEQEFLQAVDYYNECEEELGIEFAKEIYTTIQRILSFPNAWSLFSKNTRRCLANRFPYGVIYRISGDEIYIIAIMQLHREPSYWKNRK